jgi:hypothetical protein
MLDSAQNREPDARKRRSTRIVQAVPLNVTGVDALGRPFQERTSSLTINCHGCRYQSKHYVLKNMWVTLEVPHPEAGRPQRVVRGRVTWIQRPRTVRELFQIGVELEIPGNFWGIAFPPPDWFPFPDAPSSQSPAGEIESDISPSEQEFVSEPEPVSQGHNVVQMGAAATPEVSLNLARQASKLVNEAKQQIHAAAREAASKIVSQEARHILQSVEAQLSDAAAKAIHIAADQYAKHWLQRADERIEQQARTAAEALRDKWNSELETRLEDARTLLAASVTSTGQAERQTFETSLTASIETALDRLKASAEAAATRAETATQQLEQARKQFEDSVANSKQNLEEMISSRVAEANARMEELQSTAGGLTNELRYSLSLSESAWRTRMDGEMAAAQSQWNARYSEVAEQAAKIAADRASEVSAENLKATQAQISERFTQLQSHADELQANASAALAQFREGINQHAERGRAATAEVAQSAARITGLTQQIEAMEQASTQRIEQAAASLIENATQELNHRAEAAVGGIDAKIQPVMDHAGAEAVGRITSQLDQELAPKLATAEDTLAKLSSAQLNSDDALRAHQDRLWQASEHAIQESASRMQQNAERVEHDWQEGARASTEKLLGDLDTRATDITHNTIESLYKSASWYEKKVHTQMAGTLEKHIEDAGETFRAKAGEISGLFASELDHYSRSFVEHAHTQLEETTKEAVAKTQQQLGETANATIADGTSRIRQNAQLEVQRFAASMHNNFDQSVAHLEAHNAQVRARMASEAREFSETLQKNLAQQAQTVLTSAETQLAAQAAAAQETIRTAREAQERQFTDTLATKMRDATDQALTNFKGRLDSASNAWLLSSAASLHEQGELEIETLTRRTEEKLRGVFNEIFANVGSVLRDRLAGIGSALPGSVPAAPAVPASNSDPTKQS